MNTLDEKRCICGNSSTFPVCDGSHQSKNWNCARQPGQVVPWCFVAGPHNENLAAKLGAEFRGVSAQEVSEEIHTDHLVVITEGSDLESIRPQIARVSAAAKTIVAVNIDEQMLAHAFPGWPIQAIQGENSIELWRQIHALCKERFDASPAQPIELQSAFVSHAVADEPLMLEPVEYLRNFYNADIFVCADSITTGSAWHDQVLSQLAERDLFVLLVSRSSLESTFCAFEAGNAMALRKPILLVSLDGSPPPLFAQHLQMIDLERTSRLKPWLSREELLLEALLQALAGGERKRPRTQAAQGLLTILFTDIEGSTALTQRVGDSEAQEILRVHDRVVREALRDNQGSEVKHTGDGIMASFSSASSALACALAIQQAFCDHNAEDPSEAIKVRIGINAGEPVVENQDIFGTSVQLARRICDQAAPGQILASDLVRGLAAGKAFSFLAQGEMALKGFEESMTLYRLVQEQQD